MGNRTQMIQVKATLKKKVRQEFQLVWRKFLIQSHDLLLLSEANSTAARGVSESTPARRQGGPRQLPRGFERNDLTLGVSVESE